MRRARSQAGASLIEALLAVAVVSILLLGIMAGVSTSVVVAQSTGKVAGIRNALASVTERMGAASWPGCDTSEAIDTIMHTAGHPAFVEAPPGYSFAVTGVSSAYPEAATCQTSPQTSAVLLEVTVTDDSTGENLNGSVVIRDRNARPQ